MPQNMSFERFAAVFLALLVISAVPLFLTELPPLLDYPNHLARMYLLPSLPSALLERSFVVAWAPLPNLGMDGVVPFLARVMPLVWAGKAFILLTFALLAGGACALHYVLFRRWSLWPCLAFLLLYTRLLLWGFMGYLAGCGLALAFFAAWLALQNRHWALRVAAGLIFALIVYLAHLLAFGIYAVMVGCYELGQVWRFRPTITTAIRALAVGAIPFLPPLVLMSMNASEGRIVYASPLRKLDLLFSVFDNYSRPFDVVCFVGIVLAISFAFQRRWVRVAPEMALPLIGVTVLYIFMPTQLFTAAGADRRIPMMMFLMLIGSSQWMASSRIEWRFMATAGAMFAVRLAVIAVVWQSAGRFYAGLMPAFDQLPPGGCLAVAFGKDGISVQKAPLTHFPALAVMKRDDFVTTFFAYPTQQPIRLQPEAKKFADLLAPDELWYAFVDNELQLTSEKRAALERCGYVAFAGTKPFTLKNTMGLEPAFVAPRFQLYRVTPALS